MIIVGLSDIHGDVRNLPAIAEDLCRADMIVLAGDVTNFGDRSDAEHVIKELRIFNQNILAVPGNCDPYPAGQYFAEQKISLDGQCKVIDGVAFIGAGGSLSGPGRTPNENPDGTFTQRLEAAFSKVPAGSPVVLILHQPPYGTTADVVGMGRHVGSKAVREFIEKRQPTLCFCGHIHEAVGIDHIGNSTLVNPGPLRLGGYAVAELGSGEVEIKHCAGGNK